MVTNIQLHAFAHGGPFLVDRYCSSEMLPQRPLPLGSLQMLWKAQVLLQGIIDCEAYCSGWDNFDVIQAQACEKSSGSLLPDNHAQTLQRGAYLLAFLLLCTALFQVLQPLHLRTVKHITSKCSLACLLSSTLTGRRRASTVT